MVQLKSASPQFLVADIPTTVDYYREKLGFETNIKYEDFYASVKCGNAEIHLKKAEQLTGERQHRKDNEHLDAYIDVDDVSALYTQLSGTGANIIRELCVEPWGVEDFYVEDPDGYIICFAQLNN